MVRRARLPSLSCDLVIPSLPFRFLHPCLAVIVPAVPLALVVTALPHRAIPWCLVAPYSQYTPVPCLHLSHYYLFLTLASLALALLAP